MRERVPFTLLFALLALLTLMPVARAQEAGTARQKVRIDAATVVAGSVEKFVSSKQRTHVRYSFIAEGRAYQAVMFDGDWNSDALNALRHGRVALTGYWSQYKGQPSFVTTRVERR